MSCFVEVEKGWLGFHRLASMWMYLMCKAIREQTGARVLLTGEIPCELFGCKHTDFAPSAGTFYTDEEFEERRKRYGFVRPFFSRENGPDRRNQKELYPRNCVSLLRFDERFSHLRTCSKRSPGAVFPGIFSSLLSVRREGMQGLFLTLQRVIAHLAGADLGHDEELAVAHLTGVKGLAGRVDDLLHGHLASTFTLGGSLTPR